MILTENLISMESLFIGLFRQVSYSTVVLYNRDHGDLGFHSQNFTQKPASQLHPGTLAVLVRDNQAQQCLQCDPKGFQ